MEIVEGSKMLWNWWISPYLMVNNLWLIVSLMMYVVNIKTNPRVINSASMLVDISIMNLNLSRGWGKIKDMEVLFYLSNLLLFALTLIYHISHLLT